MKTEPKLMMTKNYDLFIVHEFNRPLRKHTMAGIEKSMRKYGFRASDAIHVSRSGKKLKIMRGHNRYAVAKKLGLPVYYIVDVEIDIAKEEASINSHWTVTEHVKAYANQGIQPYIDLLNFGEKYKMPVTTAAFLLGGYANKVGVVGESLRYGRFVIEPHCLDFAEKVAGILGECEIAGLRFAKTRAFITAIAALCRVKEFDHEHFIRRVQVDGRRIATRNSRDDYLEEIESLYNYRARGEYIPIRGLAIATVGKIEK